MGKGIMIYAIIALWLICGAFAGLNIALQIFENDPIEVKAMMLIAAAIVAALGPLGNHIPAASADIDDTRWWRTGDVADCL